MSKRRQPWTFEDAVHVAVAGLGLPGASAAVGKSASLVYKWGDPDIDCLPTLAQALEIDAAYVLAGHGEAPFLRAYREQVSARIRLNGGAPAHTPADPLDRVCGIAHETSEAMSAYRATVGPRTVIPLVSGNEALREIAEAIEELEAAARDIEVGMETGKPRAVDAAE